MPIKILITNDDGIHAEGLLALKSAMEVLGDVYVVAPDRQRSACGHSITLSRPLRLNRARLHDGSHGFACDGTPSDCVSLGLMDVVPGQADLVVSGINHGPNLGWDLTYSGTVSAAMEAAIMGIPAIAISIASHVEKIDYTFAAKFAAYLGGKMLESPLPPDMLLNVNVPHLPEEEIKGIEVTCQGKRRYVGSVEKRTDPMGRAYYWLGGEVVDELENGTDVNAIAQNKVSVTPVHLDLTGYPALKGLAGWGIESFSTEKEPVR